MELALFLVLMCFGLGWLATRGGGKSTQSAFTGSTTYTQGNGDVVDCSDQPYYEARDPTRDQSHKWREQEEENQRREQELAQRVDRQPIRPEDLLTRNWYGEKISPELGMSLHSWNQLKNEIKTDREAWEAEHPHQWTEWERGNAWEWGLHNVSGSLGQKWYEDLPPADGTTPPDDQPRRDDDNGYAGYY